MCCQQFFLPSGKYTIFIKNQKYILPYIFLENILLSPTKVLPTAKTIRSKSRTRLRMHPSMVSSNLQKRLRKGVSFSLSPIFHIRTSVLRQQSLCGALFANLNLQKAIDTIFSTFQ
jgi:hypothetical protein